MKLRLIKFIKKETILVVSAILALISCFIVPPSAEYINYIDFRVLGILLSLMIVMAGLQINGLFDTIGKKLLKKTKNTIQLCLVLVLLCFFFSMFITNDVALITFVPFTMTILKTCEKEKLLIPVIAVQTVAANLGSMLTPVGNPQNLYLYNYGNFSLVDFIKIMLPYSLISLVAILVWIFIICRKNEVISISQDLSSTKSTLDKKREKYFNIVYLILFLLSILVVMKVISYYLVAILVVAVVFIMDRKVLLKVDYSLIFTFCFFFIFTGNIGQMDVAKQWLQTVMDGRTVIMGTAVSQVISNVPAALLLSGFTSDYKNLLIGVNIGGLGTLIASMASLISYKIYAHEYNESKGKYLLYFTISNIIFLALLLPVAFILR